MFFPDLRVTYKCNRCNVKQAWFAFYGETEEEFKKRLDESVPCPVPHCIGTAYPIS